MNKIKILVLGYTNSIHFYRWCKFLDNSGFDVSIISFIKNNQVNYNEYKNYLDFSTNIKNSFLKIFIIMFKMIKCLFIINKSNYDYININYIEIYLLLISLFINKKIVLTSWGSDILINYANSKGIKRIIYNIIFRKSFAITCDSNIIKNTIINNCRKINKDKIKIIYWGINEELFYIPDSEEKNSLRKRFNIPEVSIVLLSIRNIEEMYNIKEIINWFNDKIKDKNIVLLIRITPKYNQKYLDCCIKIAKENKNIIFNNQVIPYDEINMLYKISDVDFHFPDSDATPVSMLEGISCGNLIICNKYLDSYKDLNSLYNINLNSLNELSEYDIIKYYNMKNDIANKNKEIFNKYHSENKTIEQLKNLFNGII